MGVKVVVAHAMATGRRMNKTSIARVNRNVTDLATLLKQEKVANGQRPGRNGDTRTSHLPRGTGQVDAILPVDILNKPRAIETASR